MKNYKSEKGAVSAFVLISMLFFLTTIIGVYTVGAKRYQTQTDTVELTQNYESSSRN